MGREEMTKVLTEGYSQRIRELVASMMLDAEGEDSFVERAGAVMTALVSEVANCAASLAVTRGIEPDVIAKLVGSNFSAMYGSRIDTLQGENQAVN